MLFFILNHEAAFAPVGLGISETRILVECSWMLSEVLWFFIWFPARCCGLLDLTFVWVPICNVLEASVRYMWLHLVMICFFIPNYKFFKRTCLSISMSPEMVIEMSLCLNQNSCFPCHKWLHFIFTNRNTDFFNLYLGLYIIVKLALQLISSDFFLDQCQIP